MRWTCSLALFGTLLFLAGCSSGSSDPCNGITQNGVCNGETSLSWCETKAEAAPVLKTQQCQAYESCQMVSNEARCALKPGKCLPGSTKCDGTKLAVCNQSGDWASTACPAACKEMAFAAYCETTVPTSTRTSKLKYQARDIDRIAMNKWSDIFEVSPSGVMVISLRGDAIVDSATTTTDGAFSIKVPTDVQSGDAIAFVAARPVTGKSGVGLSLSVVNPGFKEGKNNTTDLAQAKGTIWSWKFDLSATPQDSYLITEDKLSGVMRMFDWMNQLMGLAEGRYPTVSSQPLSMWMQPNVSWDCGACAWDQDIVVGSNLFTRQIVGPMTSQDQNYWSLAVFGHEFGHYVMSVWGVSPGEGGTHCFGNHYPPGLVWSEGWATWHSAEVRRPTGIGQIYYGKQDGTFYTIDIEKRTYSGGEKWTRPVNSAGLMQLMDENEVSAMMWMLSSGTLSASPLFQGLASARMKTSPFARGYNRSEWKTSSDGCTPTNIKDLGVSAPMVADYFDSLVCAGASAALIDAATEPTKYYPYPSATPLCK